MAAGPRKTKTAETPVEAVVEALKTAPMGEPVAEAAAAVDPAVAEVVAEVKKVQEAAKQAAAETVTALEGSFEAATKSLQAFSAKAMEAYQANATSSVHYVQALAGVRSVSEAIALMSEHMRQQYEALSAQAKELTALAQQVAIDASGPLKDQVGKAFKQK